MYRVSLCRTMHALERAQLIFNEVVAKFLQAQKARFADAREPPTSTSLFRPLDAVLRRRRHLVRSHRVSSVPCRVRQLSSRARAMVEWKTSTMMIPSTIRSVMLFTYRPSSRRHVTPAPSTANRRVETTMRTGLSSVVLISRHFVSTTRRRVCPGWRERRTTRFYTLLHEREGKYFFSFCTVTSYAENRTKSSDKRSPTNFKKSLREISSRLKVSPEATVATRRVCDVQLVRVTMRM